MEAGETDDGGIVYREEEEVNIGLWRGRGEAGGERMGRGGGKVGDDDEYDSVSYVCH